MHRSIAARARVLTAVAVIVLSAVLIPMFFSSDAQAAARVLRFLPYGDSKTVGWGDQLKSGGYRYQLAELADSAAVNWQQPTFIGRGGWTVSGMAATIDTDLARYKKDGYPAPDAVLINLGTNLTERSQKAFVTPMLQIVDKMHKAWPKAKIFIAKVYRGPNAARTLDDVWIATAVAARPGIAYNGIDERTFLPGRGLMSDTVHPNHAGYVATAQAWEEVLKAHFPDSPFWYIDPWELAADARDIYGGSGLVG